jgi:chromosome segregation ATPase
MTSGAGRQLNLRCLETKPTLFVKKFLPNLLIVFSIVLCGLNAVQWVREAKLHAEIAGHIKDIERKAQTIQNLESTVRRSEAEIMRLDKLRNELIEVGKSNKTEIAALTKQNDKLKTEVEGGKNQMELYKDAIEKANANILAQNDAIKKQNDAIQKQNEDIKFQNEEMKKLAEERNGAVVKYNQLVGKFNETVKVANKLQEDLAKAQEDLAKAAGNKGKEK